MKIQNVAISRVIPYDLNPRKNEGAVRKVAESLENFGWQQPIVVDPDLIVIAGHTRLAAAQLLGMPKVPVLVASDLNPAQVKAYRLADNKVAEYSEWDEELLIEELMALRDAEADLDTTGFSVEELDKLLAEDDDLDVKPQVIFSEEMMEANNYVVLVFRNEVDWLSAQTHFGLSTKHSKRQNGKPWSAGIGRVVDGAEYLAEQTTEDHGD